MKKIHVSGPVTGKSFFPSLQGSKNAALPIITAAAMCKKIITLSNIPLLDDVENLIAVLQFIGVKIKRISTHSLRIDGSTIKKWKLPSHLTKQSRGSMYGLIPALSSFNKCKLGVTGGDAFNRSFVLQERVLHAFGFACKYQKNGIDINGTIKPAHFRIGGKGIISNSMAVILSSMCEKKSTIEEIDFEPEVEAVIAFMQRLGVKIKRRRHAITITPPKSFRSIHFQVPSDRIQAQTWVLIGIATHTAISIPSSMLANFGAFTECIKEMGVKVQSSKKHTRFIPPKKLLPARFTTNRFPAIHSDIVPIFVALLTQSHGNSSIRESYPINRFAYVPALKQMGAVISHTKDTIRVMGPTPLAGKIITENMGIRETMAIILAGLIGSGKTTIQNGQAILRGYEWQFMNEINRLAKGQVIQLDGFDRLQ